MSGSAALRLSDFCAFATVSAPIMTLLRGSHHSRLVTTTFGATGSTTLVHRLVHRQFSTAPICKSKAPRVDNETYVKTLKAGIKFINEHPDLTAEFKYRNSKRIFAILDTAASRKETYALIDKRKPILRAIEQPEVIQRLEQGLPDPDLTRAANFFRELLNSYEKESAVHWHAFKLIMGAHLSDAPIWPRIVHIPRHIKQEWRRRFARRVLQREVTKYARWLS